MKRSLKLTRLLLLSFVILLLLTASTAAFSSVIEEKKQKSTFVEQELKTKAEIPIFQRVEVIEKKDINYSALMRNYKGKNEVVLKNALTLKLLSNADWQLRLNNKNLDSQIMIKRSGDGNKSWQKLNKTSAKFRGEYGVQEIAFDLKVILSKNPDAAENLDLDLRCSLEPILY